jgi:uncharacterized protein
MELSRLIESLGKPAAYRFALASAVAEIEIRQTHISVVFLAGPFAYKVKKPVDFGFLDFSTLAKRRHFCDEEVRLNRRLAPDVYLGVVPITNDADGLHLEGTGDPVEWAVKMRRLPDQVTLHERLQRGEVDERLVGELALRLAAFHRKADSGPRIATLGRFDPVARNLRDIYAQSVPQIGQTVSETVYQQLTGHNEAALARLKPLIEERARHGVTRDCHGDLHLDHIYYFPDREPPGDLVIVDCIEFTERFRFIDPVADMAFPMMDLRFHGRRDLARVFADAYFAASGDEGGRPLLPLYTAYRATVRGSVEGLKLAEKEVPAAERTADLQHARAHWLLALGELAPEAERPCLLLVGGLPGTGKTSLAHGLAEQAGFTVIRSDVVRKELAGVPESARASAYSTEWTERTYAECLRRAEARLFQGGRVIVDANFREESRRQMFFKAAHNWGVPGAMLICRADEETIRQRLAHRKGDASDADWSVYESLRRDWEEPAIQENVQTIDTGAGLDEATYQAIAALRRWKLLA